jgi:hypothetical protein
MSGAMNHCLFRRSVAGLAGILATLSLSMPARAAISNGPMITNAVAAEEQRIIQFHQAEESYQEKLKVGRDRYNQKQMNRAKIIAAMSSELQARQQSVKVEPVEAPDAKTDESVSSVQPWWLTAAVLVSGFIGFGIYRKRQARQNTASQKRPPAFESASRADAKTKASKPRTAVITKAPELFVGRDSHTADRSPLAQKGFEVLKDAVGREQKVHPL